MNQAQNIQQLMAMGFSQQQSQAALQACQGNLMSAAEMLATGVAPQMQPQNSQQSQNTQGGSGSGGGVPALGGGDEMQRAIMESQRSAQQDALNRQGGVMAQGFGQ